MRDVFYRNNRMTASLEHFIDYCETLEDLEKQFPEEFLKEDTQIGDYLEAAAVSKDAGLAFSYVGHIINGKRNNPSRDALISICFAIGTTFEEAQYLLKYAGQAPLYVRRKRDVVIWFGFMKKQSLDEVNAKLIERGMKPLIRE